MNAENPYSVGVASKQFSQDLNTVSQVNKYKEDETQQKSYPILPYDLQEINQVLSDIFTSLVTIKHMLARAKESETINNGPVEDLNNRIDDINKSILEFPEVLDKLKL